MEAIRRARLENLIQAEVSTIARNVKDPRVPATLTFTQVRLTEDGKQATIFVSSFDHSAEPNHFISGLTSAAGFFRRHLAKALTVRHIPTLIFKHDKGIENSIRVHEILNQIANER